MEMNTDGLMIFPELNAGSFDFDFDSMVGSKDYSTITGIEVRIDRIIKDITKTTVLAISGTMLIRGIKVRGVWDMYGNIVECKKMLSLFTPRAYATSLENIFSGTTKDMFRLVAVQKLDK